MKEKYHGAFIVALIGDEPKPEDEGYDEKKHAEWVEGCKLITEDIKYGEGKWDSISHMSLVSQLEERFQFQMDTDDIIGLSSYKTGLEILKKYVTDAS